MREKSYKRKGRWEFHVQSEVESWQRKRVGRCRRSRSRTHARNVAKHFTGASTLAVGGGGGVEQ